MYLSEAAISFLPVDSWCSYPDQKLPRGYRLRKLGCFSKIIFDERDFNIISASSTEYPFGTSTLKWVWLPPKPIGPNLNPEYSNSLNAASQSFITDCFRKQLYRYLQTNIIVIQLFLVSFFLD